MKPTGGGGKAGMSSVGSDVAGAMARLVDHLLLDHGQRRIAFLKDAEGNSDSQRRLEVLYPHPACAQSWNHFTVPQELTLAMAVVDGEVLPPGQLGRFDASRFLPVSPYGHQAGCTCAVFPLFLHSQHFGYMVLNIDAKLDLSFEQVHADVSGLITSTALIGELFRTGDRLREDLSRQQDMNQRLRTLAQRDDLTGQLNRRGFFTRVAELRQRDTRHEALLLAADLDGLKQINDRHGHAAGDKALQAAAQVLAATFREEDAVARLGGNEFAVFTDHAANRARPGILHRLRLAEHNQASAEPTRGPWRSAWAHMSSRLGPRCRWQGTGRGRPGVVRRQTAAVRARTHSGIFEMRQPLPRRGASSTRATAASTRGAKPGTGRMGEAAKLQCR